MKRKIGYPAAVPMPVHPTSILTETNMQAPRTPMGKLSRLGQVLERALADPVETAGNFVHAASDLGSGIGAYVGDPSSECNQFALGDIGTISSLGMAGVGGFEYMNRPYWRYVGPNSRATFAAGGSVLPGTWLTRGSGFKAPFGEDFPLAKDRLQLPGLPEEVIPVKVPWNKYVGSGRGATRYPVIGSGGGIEFQVGGYVK